MRRIVVERGRFALPKTHKSHIRHEPDAQLSTSTITGSSPLVSLKKGSSKCSSFEHAQMCRYRSEPNIKYWSWCILPSLATLFLCICAVS